MNKLKEETFFKPYKERSVEIGERVDCYRNLHTNNGYSIRSSKTGLVLAHCSTVSLENCTFHVSEGGRQKTVQQKRKREHALVWGDLFAINATIDTSQELIYYNPYLTELFTVISVNQPIVEASEVHCKGKYCYF